jgi:hypothetical protein
MNGLYDLLPKVKQRPGMYLGSASISALRFFLQGYHFARREGGIKITEEESDFYKNFQPWLQQKFQVQTVNSWDKIILLYSVDEKEGFAYFFELLDDFLTRDKSLEKEPKNTHQFLQESNTPIGA